MGCISEACVKVSGRSIHSTLVGRDTLARKGKARSDYLYNSIRSEESIGFKQLDV